MGEKIQLQWVILLAFTHCRP